MEFAPKELQALSLRAGDLVVVEGGAGFGRSTLLREALSGWGFQNHIIRLRAISDAEPRFLDYCIKASLAGGHITTLSNHATIPSLSSEKLARMLVPLPAPEEQQTIADFLDRETAKIDELLGKQDALIELLGERRKAVVSRAVTTGLDATVPMKTSGASWLGKIPAHWSAMALKRLLQIPITDGPHETPEFLDSGVPFVSAEAISSGEIDFAKIRGFISYGDHLRYQSKYSPRLNDIFMIKSGATTGVVAMVKDNRVFDIWSPLAAIRCKAEIEPRYIVHFLRSTEFQRGVSLFWTYGTQQNIGMKTLENLQVAVPPAGEQIALANYLDEACAEIDEVTERATRCISLLQERRSALITAAVTGKIDVRGEV